jgi:hypothetical protein
MSNCSSRNVSTTALTRLARQKQGAIIPWIAMVLIWTAFSRSEAAPAEAVLSSNSATVGQPLMLQITVESSRVQPPQIHVNGLDIRFAGTSSQVSIQNFDMTASTVFSYQVTGQREGNFKIPQQVFVVDGKRVRTPELRLTITANRSSIVGSLSGGHVATPSGNRAEPVSESEIAFGELVIPSGTVYVGQAIPVELRMYFNANARIRVEEMPKIESEGFTIEKFPDPKQSRVAKNGRTYDVLTFKTVVTPVKAGKVVAGPARMQCTITIPRRRPQFPHVDDFFNDDFFNDPFGAFATNRTLTVESDAPQLNVAPLPVDGQPESYSGAIGQFTLATAAGSGKVEVGEPVNLTIRIAGKGNFSRIGAPELIRDDAWRSYPPSDMFEALDDLGITGTKAFEFALVAEHPTDATPGVEFSYFDPSDGVYKTLEASPIAIQVDGLSKPAATPGADATTVREAEKGSEERLRDLHTIALGEARWNRSFTPLYARPGFWVAQSVPLLGLLSLAGFRVRRSRDLDTRARRTAAQKREYLAAIKELRRGGLSSRDFCETAVRALQIDAGILLDRPPSSLGCDEIISARSVDRLTAHSLRNLFEKHAELRYAGATLSEEDADPENRAAWLKSIQSYESSKVC